MGTGLGSVLLHCASFHLSFLLRAVCFHDIIDFLTTRYGRLFSLAIPAWRGNTDFPRKSSTGGYGFWHGAFSVFFARSNFHVTFGCCFSEALGFDRDSGFFFSPLTAHPLDVFLAWHECGIEMQYVLICSSWNGKKKQEEYQLFDI